MCSARHDGQRYKDDASRPGAQARVDARAAAPASGTVFAWGYNSMGELGDGTTTERHLLVAVGGLPGGDPVVTIAARGWHNLALTVSGAIYAWGGNYHGQLGDGTTTNSTVPVAVSRLPAGDPVAAIAAGYEHSLALTTSGVLYAWGGNGNGEFGDGTTADRHLPARVHLPLLDAALAVSAGFGFTLALVSEAPIQPICEPWFC